MCYLRNFSPIQKQFYEQSKQTNDFIALYQIQNDYSKKNYIDVDFFQSLKTQKVNKRNSQLFQSMLKLAQENSQSLRKLFDKVEHNAMLLEQTFQFQKRLKQINSLEENEIETQQSLGVYESYFKSQQSLTKKLFGEEKKYKYKLELQDGFPQKIFKQRNFSFGLKLIDGNGNIIRNSNLIHLCLGVCDADGEWVNEGKGNERLVKGKSEQQLYDGEGSYNKIFLRDVSRYYKDGKLNLVVYAKKSAMKYNSQRNMLCEIVNSQQIEPLLIKNLVVKAKKKDQQNLSNFQL